MRQIKDGRYFSDAREWYAVRYLMPIPERSLLLLITSFSLIAGMVAVWTSYSMFPVIRPYEVIIKVDDSKDNYSVIRRLTEPNLTTRQSIAKYLLQDYVTVRESYDYKEFGPQFARMREASSKKVYREFEQEMSTSNPNSRTVNFGKYMTRSTKVLSSAFAEEGRYTEKAAVIFETTVIGKKGEKSVERWGAHISYTLEDISKIVKEREKNKAAAASKKPDAAKDAEKSTPADNRLEFIVTSYKVQKIS